MTTVQHQRSTGPQRLRVDEVGDVLLVSVGGVHPATAAVARALPAEAGRISVVMPDADLAYHPDLVPRLCRWVPVRYESVRLVAPCAATADPSGRIPAQALCELLEADVVAPDGELIAVPGGALYVLPTGAARTDGQWWRYRPGRTPLVAGRRFPTPEWERDLADLPEPGIPEVTVEQIPAGLWVRRSRGRAGPVEPADLAYAIPIQSESVTMLVSRPGDAPLRATDLRRMIEVMPASLLERIVVTPYGDTPVADGELGAVASVAANRTLRVRTGLPIRLSGRGQQVAAIGADGMPTWTPFAREIAWRPHGGGRVLSWTAPAEQLLPAGSAQLMLNERWLVEIIEAGLWIREMNRTEGASTVRQLPLLAEHCTVVIGVGDEDQAQPPWRAIDRLLRRLPPEAQSRLRLAVPAAAGEALAEALVKGLRRILQGVSLLVLTGGGRLVGPGAAQATDHSGQTVVDPAEHTSPTETRSSASSRRGRAAVDEVGRLLHYVDQIRRAPAWDELPTQRAAEPTQPAVELTKRAAEPAPGRAESVPRPVEASAHRPEPAPSPPVPVEVPVVVPVPVVVTSSDAEAGPEPAARPARGPATPPAEADPVGQPNEET
ncbi:hypothetical protein ACWDV4_19690 [Micromonospora sp. NPDC003197]